MQAGRRDWHFCLADELSLMDTQANDLWADGHQSTCTPIVLAIRLHDSYEYQPRIGCARPTAEFPRRDIEPEPLQRARYVAPRRSHTSHARPHHMHAGLRRP